MSPRRGWPSRWIAVLAIAAWLGILIVLIAREPADGTVTARVSTVDSHRLCVTGDREVCLANDRPTRLDGIEEGACVRARYSSEGLLMAVEPGTGCP